METGKEKLNHLVAVYASGGMEELAEAYAVFRNDAILDYELYLNCQDRLTKAAEKMAQELEQGGKKRLIEEKLRICATFTKICSVLQKNLKDTKNRQELIDTMGEKISKAYEDMYGVPEYRNNMSICYLDMHIILDLCFACFGEERGYFSRLHLPAIFYDLMHRWNEQNKENLKNNRYEKISEGFVEFYGDTAEAEIVKYTHRNLEIYCKSRNKNVLDWLKEWNDPNCKKYAVQFKDQLINVERRKIQAEGQKKGEPHKKEEKQNSTQTFAQAQNQFGENKKEKVLAQKQAAKKSGKVVEKNEPASAVPETEAPLENQTEQKAIKEKKRSNKWIKIILVAIAVVVVGIGLIVFGAISRNAHKTAQNYNSSGASRSFSDEAEDLIPEEVVDMQSTSDGGTGNKMKHGK